MEEVKKHLMLLGKTVSDKVTGFTGIAESVAFDLYGCVQVVIKPKIMNDKGDLIDGRWFDASRISVVSEETVMELPKWHPSHKSPVEVQRKAVHGPADKILKRG